MQLSSFSGNFIAYLTCLCDSESAHKEADRSLADYQFASKLQLSSMLYIHKALGPVPLKHKRILQILSRS
jgi:hypothetical protein